MAKLREIVVTALASALFSGAAPSAHPQDGTQVASADEAAAEALLQKGEAKAARGQYKQAVDDYERLAKRYPETHAGRLGLERTRPSAYLGSSLLVDNGPASNRIEVTVMADGFPLEDQKLFDGQAKQVPKIFERYRVFEEYFGYHNFVRVNVASRDADYDRGLHDYDTALGGRDSGVAEKNDTYVTVDRAEVKKRLDNVSAHEGLAIALVRKGTVGVSNQDVAVVTRLDDTIVHEWGHVFGGLGDERDQFTGHPYLPDAPNVSQLSDAGRVPWKRWIGAGAPGVGVYEGALGLLKGAWKPTGECAMGTGSDFCVVCREALVLRIHEHVDPIDGCSPAPQPLTGGEQEPLVASDETGSLDFEVQLLRPRTHALLVRWWVLPAEKAPEAPTPLIAAPRADPDKLTALYGAREIVDRRLRGPLASIGTEPAHEARTAKGGTQEFELDPGDYEPGRYRVVCRVKDPVDPRDDDRPWVLHDPHGLLESERAWWVEVR